MIQIAWVSPEADHIREIIVRAFGESQVGWVELAPGADGIRVVAAVRRRWGGDVVARWLFDDMRDAIQEALETGGHKVDRPRDGLKPYTDPGPPVWAADEAHGFEMSEPRSPQRQRPSVDPSACPICGGTGVVSRTRYPEAPSAPGYIDSMGLCPACHE
jgi:hypothetical protein